MGKKLYKPEYCDDMIKYLSKGYSNLELAAKFNITEKSFYQWLKDHPDFQEAYDIGHPKRFLYYMDSARKAFLEGKNDKGYKFFKDLIRYTYKDYAPEGSKDGTTNIQIGNINMLEYKDKTPEQLYQILQTKMLHIKPVEISEGQLTEGTLIEHDDTSQSE